MNIGVRISAAVSVSMLLSSLANAAPMVTFVESTMERTQPQGAGTYRVLDFFYSSSPGAEFTNYTLDVTAFTGTLHDPARLQDDRQTNPAVPGQDGNTAGAVDTWANTVMSSAAKIDGGFTATILADPVGYAPTGSGPSPGFTRLKWDVFDNVQFDDNNLNDHPEGPFTSAAPYHIARVLASTNASGTFTFTAYDTANPGVGTVFTPGLGGWGGTPNTPPVVNPQIFPYYANPIEPVTTFFTASDAEDPLGPFTFSNAQLTSYIPFRPGSVNPPFNGTVSPGGLFNWDIRGFRFGTYVIDVVATDPDGASSLPGGNFVVVYIIPEPTTLSLCAVALFAACGLSRRRILK